jgi:hypothetical protein
VAGHFSVEKIVAMLQKHFYWLKLRQEVRKYIRSFTACDISNQPLRNRLYTPLPTPNRPWESISMDYMLGLQSTKQGNDCVFWLLIAFLRWRFWSPARRASQQRPLPRSSLNEFWVHFGIPQTIVSYWDSQFLNTFWSSLWSLLDTKLTKSMTFHP